MRSTKTALLTLVTALACTWGVASAQPAQPPQVSMLTLTTLPSGWEGRTDLRPMLDVLADGHAVKSPDAAAPDRGPDKPPQKLTGRIPADVLSTALTEIKALAALDLGMPSAADGGRQIIDFMPLQPDQDVHLIMYAPDLAEGLTTEQQQNRDRFTGLYRKLLDAFVQD